MFELSQHTISQLENLIPCIIAGLCSFVLGIERQRREKAAGIRTHLLVSLGACLFTIASIYISQIAIVSGASNIPDPGRIAAQVVSGIGFLGGGVILHNRNRIQGLTTASTVWISAAIGMLCGARLYVLAIGASILNLIFLYIGRRMSHIVRANMFNWSINLKINTKENADNIDPKHLKTALISILEKEKSLKIIDTFISSSGQLKLTVNYRGSNSVISNLVRSVIPPQIDYDLEIKTAPRTMSHDNYLSLLDDDDD